MAEAEAGFWLGSLHLPSRHSQYFLEKLQATPQKQEIGYAQPLIFAFSRKQASCSASVKTSNFAPAAGGSSQHPEPAHAPTVEERIDEPVVPTHNPTGQGGQGRVTEGQRKHCIP